MFPNPYNLANLAKNDIMINKKVKNVVIPFFCAIPHFQRLNIVSDVKS